MNQSEHYQNFLRYQKKQLATIPHTFTASQQVTPPQYLPYAQYPYTPEEDTNE